MKVCLISIAYVMILRISNVIYRSFSFSIKKMSNRKARYSHYLEEDLPWIKHAGDPQSTKCEICDKIFLVSGSGVSQVKINKKSKKHITRANDLDSTESTLLNSDNSYVNIYISIPVIYISVSNLVYGFHLKN